MHLPLCDFLAVTLELMTGKSLNLSVSGVTREIWSSGTKGEGEIASSYALMQRGARKWPGCGATFPNLGKTSRDW